MRQMIDITEKIQTISKKCTKERKHRRSKRNTSKYDVPSFAMETPESFLRKQHEHSHSNLTLNKSLSGSLSSIEGALLTILIIFLVIYIIGSIKLQVTNNHSIIKLYALHINLIFMFIKPTNILIFHFKIQSAVTTRAVAVQRVKHYQRFQQTLAMSMTVIRM